MQEYSIPKVSIIVTMYNFENYIYKCLMSCINQSLRDIEIICINDGSQDNTKNIIEEIALKDSRVKVVNKLNEGVNVARRVGLDMAKSDYIYFVDGDDYVPLNAIELLYEKHIEEDADVVFGSFNRLNSNGEYISTHNTVSQDVVISGPSFLDLYLGVSNVGLWSKLIKKELLYGVTVINNYHFTEDFIYFIQYMSKAQRVCTIDEVVYNWIIHPTSTFHTIQNKPIDTTYFLGIRAVEDVLERTSLSDTVKNKVLFNLFMRFFNTYVCETKGKRNRDYLNSILNKYYCTNKTLKKRVRRYYFSQYIIMMAATIDLFWGYCAYKIIKHKLNLKYSVWDNINK